MLAFSACSHAQPREAHTIDAVGFVQSRARTVAVRNSGLVTHRHIRRLACITLAIVLVLISAAVAACTGDTPVKESTAPPAAQRPPRAAVAASHDDRALRAGRHRRRCRRASRATNGRRSRGWSRRRASWTGCFSGRSGRATRRCSNRSRAGRRRPAGGDAADALHYFLINKGPWSRLDHHEPFIPGAPAKPESANFYPAGATKDEIQKWLDSLTGSAKTAATGFFTTIRRGPDGRFMAVPYSVEYQGELALAASLLREAAQLTTQPTLKKFLTSRADAFISNDYYASDVAWMELDASIEPTIGPYEVYEDEWFNFKAAFEAFITVRDEAESKKLQVFGAELQGLENALPIDPALRNPKLGALAPIKVVNVVFTAGDANRGVQTAAFNLPNDERVVKEKGTKRVMLKNVQEAKFRMVAGTDREGRAARGRSRRTSPSTRSSPTS